MHRRVPARSAAAPTSAQPNSAKAPVTRPSEFARSLAAAARRQVSYFVFYNSSYQKIPYPMGDVPSYFGVCTDVVVRAYRALGIDLQVQVQKAGVGTGDTNIDHRRVEVLRRFFARAGTSLPITRNPDDYKVGDIVTYYMPNGWLSKTHIAIVAAEKNLRRRAAGHSQPRLGRAGGGLAVRREDHRPLPLRWSALTSAQVALPRHLLRRDIL